MAELGITASIIGIVGFALNLSKKLYQFATTTSVAGEHVDYIAKNITNFADALELLAERLDADDEPIYSTHTARLIARMYDQSCDLFDKIEELIPEPRRGRDELSFVQKVAWNFKKGRVEFLAGQIEYLKTTVSLIATVLFAGKKIKSKRSSHRRKPNKTQDSIDLNRIRQRVTIAVVEHQEASSKLPDLQEKAMVEERVALQDDELLSCQNDTGIEARSKSLVSSGDFSYALQLYKNIDIEGADREMIILQDNDDLLLRLVDRFTTLNTRENNNSAHPTNLDNVDGFESLRHAEAAGLSDSSRAVNFEKSNSSRRQEKRVGERADNEKARTGKVYNNEEDERATKKTPEVRGDVPLRPRDFRETPVSKRMQSTKYAIVDEIESGEDAPRRHPTSRISQSISDMKIESDSTRQRATGIGNDSAKKKVRSSRRSSTLETIVEPHINDDQREYKVENGWDRYDEKQPNYLTHTGLQAELSSVPEKFRALQDGLHNIWMPRYYKFKKSPPPSREKKHDEYRWLRERINEIISVILEMMKMPGDSKTWIEQQTLLAQAQTLKGILVRDNLAENGLPRTNTGKKDATSNIL